MEYVITNGKIYLSLNRDNQQTTDCRLHRAIAFDVKEKAENYLKNIKSTLRKFDWYVDKIDSVYEDNKIKKSSINNTTIINTENNSVDWLLKISELEKYNNELLIQRSELEEQQSHVDKELSDVYHFIKDHKPPAHIRVKVYGIEQDVLLKREKIKEQLRYVNIMLNIFDENLSKGAILTQMKNAQKQDYRDRTGVYSQLQDLLTYK